MKGYKKFLIGLAVFVIVIVGYLLFPKSRFKSISYEEVNKMKDDKESFVFVLTKDGCGSCHNLSIEINNLLNKEEDLIIYNLAYESMSKDDASSLKEITIDILGEDYYENKGLNVSLYTPTIYQVVEGEITYAEIGYKTEKTLRYFLQYNYLELSYYNLKKKINNDDSFTLHCYSNKDSLNDEYKESLRLYYLENEEKGYSFDYYQMAENDTYFLDMINAFKDDQEFLTVLPEYFTLNFENGEVKGFTINTILN